MTKEGVVIFYLEVKGSPLLDFERSKGVSFFKNYAFLSHNASKVGLSVWV